MKILVHGLSGLHGGLETFLLTYCGAILRNHPDVSFDFVIYGDVPAFVDPLSALGCRFFPVTPRIVNPVKNRKQLSALFDKCSYDLVWFNVNTLSDITLLKLANNKHVRTVVHSHNSRLMGNKLNAALHYLHRPVMENAVDLALACSGDAAKYLYSDTFCSSEKCHVLPNAIDCNRYRFSPVDREEIRSELNMSSSFVVGHVGRFAHEKNHSFLLKVFKEITLLRPESKLILLGSGPEEERVCRSIDSLGLSGDVVMLGSVPDAFRYYSAMDCFVFPSLFEGMPLSLLEAQANGLNCIASDLVPGETFALDSCSKFSLQSPASDWAHACIDKETDLSMRSKTADLLLAKGYDVSTSAERLYGYLCEAAAPGN